MLRLLTGFHNRAQQRANAYERRTWFPGTRESTNGILAVSEISVVESMAKLSEDVMRHLCSLAVKVDVLAGSATSFLCLFQQALTA